MKKAIAFVLFLFAAAQVKAEISVIQASVTTHLLRGTGEFETKFATRTVTVEGTEYQVVYEYQPMYATIPLTNPPGAPHYTAVIQIKRFENGQFVNLGESFGGQYTDNGCFEDDPETLVKELLKRL